MMEAFFQRRNYESQHKLKNALVDYIVWNSIIFNFGLCHWVGSIGAVKQGRKIKLVHLHHQKEM
jgi:hypothetical protein